MDDGEWGRRAEVWWAQRAPVTQGLLLLVGAALAGTLALSWRASPYTVPPPPAVSAEPVLVHVAGAVTRPGLYRLAAGARVADALGAAGGATTDAALDGLNLARVLEDGEQLVVAGSDAAVPGAAVAGVRADGRVDLNRAGQAELDALPGIGPVLAARIVAYREAHGGFRSVRDLRRVQGIGEKLYRSLAELVAV